MKELFGYVKNIPSAARHRALRWQLESIARLIVWHAACAFEYTAEAVARWLRRR